jgi:putative glutamate/gamma-aminobutyrate antiporter
MGKNKTRTVTVFMLAMINIAAICNIANLPFTAKFGFSSLFYYVLGITVFFIPVALISAELATAWPQRGGVYIWVREALGEKAGFVAIWLQWIENVIWYPTILSVSAATFAYTFNPALAQNRFYIMASVLLIYWGITFINFMGMEISGWISTLCVILGTIIPGVLIIFLGSLWMGLGNPSHIEFSWSSLIPEFNSFDQLSLIAAVLLAFSGLEMSAVHAKEVQNPQKDYPKAILLSTIIIMAILSMGALSIAVIVPKEKIELASGAIEAIRVFLEAFKVSWALPFVALLMTIGSLGMISTWTVGPSKGLMATARHGELPPFLQKMNKKDMPVSILTIQAIIVSILSSVFLLMPTVSSSYYILFYLTSELYLIMYIMMFISGIVLKYKYPEVKRSFSVPGGKIGMIITASMGVLSSLFAMCTGFYPPLEIQAKHIVFFECFIIGGIVVFCVIPLIIHKMRKPSWHKYKNE